MKSHRRKINLQTSNRNLNDWKLYINWNMLEWVNPIIKIVRKKPIQILHINTILIKMIKGKKYSIILPV